MLKCLKKLKVITLFIILINISSLMASELNLPIVQVQYQSSFANKGDIIKQLYNEDGLLIYDAVIRLLEEIERGDLDEICTNEDWSKINHFLAFLAKQGIMPNATEEEKAELEQDIQELLNPYENNVIFANSFYKIDGLQILPAIDYGQSEIHLCKSWFKKQYKHVGKFVKKHKTAVIVGTVVVVAVVATVAIASTTAAAAAAATAAADSHAPKTNKEVTSSNSEPVQSFDNSNSNIYEPNLQQAFDDQILTYKNIIAQNDLSISSSTSQNYLYPDNERIIGSALAHGALENISQNISSETYEQIIVQAHGKIDSVFSTDQTLSYMDKTNIFNTSEKTFQKNIFYLQGQQALNAHCFDKAIDNFGKALEYNPNNHNIYLDRAYAYLEKGEFDNSLNDYNSYKENEQKKCFSKSLDILKDSADFCIGARIGLDKGVIESGKQILSFAANTITHPIKTYTGFVEAIQALSDLAKDNEWKAVSEIMTPEVCALINEWETLSQKERGERSGYIIGKFGTDILLPDAAIKAISQGMKGAKEFVIIAKNLQKTEKVIVLEALAETGGSSGTFAEALYTWETTESTLNTVGKYSKNITNLITSKKLGSSKKIIDSLIKETFENKGYFTSKYGLTYNEALDGGLKFLGKEYKEIGKSGSGVFKSADGLRQFRIDKTSIAGKHSPNVPHFHLELLEKGSKKPVVINHIILLE